jgi:2-methylcitrate dehydratase PrpD
LRQEAQPRLASIARITIGVTPYCKDRAIDTYPWSEDSARFSLPYLIATSILHGPPLSKAFTEAALDDDKVRRLAALCEIVVDEEIAKLPRGIASPGRVTIAFKEGAPLSKVVYEPSGTPANPMDQKAIEAKFMDCATRTMARDKADRLYACLQTLSKQETSRDLWPLLTP